MRKFLKYAGMVAAAAILATVSVTAIDIFQTDSAQAALTTRQRAKLRVGLADRSFANTVADILDEVDGGTLSTGIINLTASANTVLAAGTFANTGGSGVPVSSANTGAVRFYADDAGAAMTTGNLRNMLARTLLTTDSANAGSMRSVVGQLKLLAGVDITSANSVLAGVFGYLELAGTHTFGGNVAAGEFTIESTDDVTVSSGAVLAGVASRLNMASGKTVTETGKVAAFYADVTGGAGDKWSKAFYVQGSGADLGLSMGDHSSTQGSGLNLNTVTATNRFHADDGGVTWAAGNRRNVLARTLSTLDSSNGVSLRSIIGQQKINTGVDLSSANSVLAGVMGYLEFAGISTQAGQVAAGEFTVEGADNITNNGELYGVASRINMASSKSISGVQAAYHAGTTGTAGDNWAAVMHVNGADYWWDLESASAYEDGAKIADGVAGDTGSEGTVGFDALARIDIGGTAYYIALFDAGSVTGE